MSGSSTTREFFWVEFCPAMHECSSQSWKNAKVWGWTEDECRGELMKHLTNSSKHNMSFEDRQNLVDGVDLHADVYEEQPQQQQQQQQPPQKRSKVIGAGQQQQHQQQQQELLAIGAGQQQQHQQQQQQEYSEIEITEMQLAQHAQQAQDQQDHVGRVVLRQVEFDSIIDSVGRAATCARYAQKLAAQASKAFGDEVAALENTKAHLETIKLNAELDVL
jgi:hypothetical protein